MPSSNLPWLASPTSNLSFMTVPAMLLGVILAVNLLGKLIRKTVLIPKLTIMDDLPNVGRKRADGKIKGRAVVCGGR